MESVHDFYKPRRERFTETPVFDGQFSNLCYQNRMQEALDDFRRRALSNGLFRDDQFLALSERWTKMIFHLPYAFHAKRMYTERFIFERKAKGVWEADKTRLGIQEPDAAHFEDGKAFDKARNVFLKSVSESALYTKFVKDKLEQAQRASQETGNLYTASIFLALMSALELSHEAGQELKGKQIGFVAYGSGSKAKVFEAVVQADWHTITNHFNVFKKIADRQAVDYDRYELLHTGAQTTSIHPEKGRWGLNSIGKEGVTLGARYYSAF
jgi:hydroxymethylglutaryl-CoA synthase